MKQLEKIVTNPWFKWVLAGLMLIAIFIYLLNADFSSAPEFIYNQF